MLQDKVSNLEKQLKIKSNEIIENENDISTLLEQSSNDKKAVLKQILSLENTIETLKEEINKLTDKIFQKDSLIDEQTKINKSLNEKLDMRYYEFSKIAYEEWERANIKLFQENELLEQNCEKLLNRAAKLNDEIKTLEGRVEYWDELVMKYVQNIDENIIKNALNASLFEHTSLSANEIACAHEIACTNEAINSIYTKESVKGT